MRHSMLTMRHGNLHDHWRQIVIGCGLLVCAAPCLTAATLCVSPSGRSGCKTTISAAVSAASAGDTIQVAPGTYNEQVVITKPVSLVASRERMPVIDATGLNNGIFVNGMAAAPNAGVADVLISGFNVQNANFEGILVANATGVILVDNKVHDNNRALDIAGASCAGIPAFETNEGEDCGEGIHLMGTDHVSVVRNDVGNNSGGILISDETGPSHANLITGNNVHDNPYDCGITIASHGPATSIVPSQHLPFGITNNTVADNVSEHNGYQTPGAGAGVGIFAPFPGTTNAGNVVIHNEIRNNGLPGVTMHNHAWSPFAPPVNLNDNAIIGNHISGNAADTEDAATPGPTGINLYSVAPVWGTVISQNVIDDEAVDVAFKAPAGKVEVHLNSFFGMGIGVDNLGAGNVSATENWWKCPRGPGASGCATVEGTGVTTAPWLTSPFEPNP
jgi:nitrous oxidase accessory protein NosD